MFCIDIAKVHLTAVLQLEYKKNSYVSMNLESSHFILKSFLHFYDFELLYSYELYFIERSVMQNTKSVY